MICAWAAYCYNYACIGGNPVIIFAHETQGQFSEELWTEKIPSTW